MPKYLEFRRVLFRSHRDHELVVLACLRGEGRRAPAERAPAGTGYREPAEIDLRPDPARPAELPHVLDEPVAHVDHRARHTGEEASRAHAPRRVRQASPGAGGEPPRRESGRAE